MRFFNKTKRAAEQREEEVKQLQAQTINALSSEDLSEMRTLPLFEKGAGKAVIAQIAMRAGRDSWSSAPKLWERFIGELLQDHHLPLAAYPTTQEGYKALQDQINQFQPEEKEALKKMVYSVFMQPYPSGFPFGVWDGYLTTLAVGLLSESEVQDLAKYAYTSDEDIMHCVNNLRNVMQRIEDDKQKNTEVTQGVKQSFMGRLSNIIHKKKEG